MTPEQVAHEFLRSRTEVMKAAQNRVYFGEAPAGTSEPYIILYPILSGRVGAAGAFFPYVQINCFESDQFRVLELADLVVEETDGYTGPMGAAYTNSCHSERLQPLRNDDGTYMCPVSMRFAYLKEG